MSGSNVVLWALTVSDVEDMIGRLLLPGEASTITKSLEHVLGEVWEDAVYSTTDLVSVTEARALELKEGDFFFGDDEWIKIDVLAQHGDTILITSPEVQGVAEYSFDIDMVIERAIIKSEEDA